MGRPEAAKTAFQLAASGLDKLVEANRGVPEYASNLAQCYYYLGSRYRAAGQSAMQEEAWKKSAAVSEKLVREFPNVSDYADDLGRTYYNLGVLAVKQD